MQADVCREKSKKKKERFDRLDKLGEARQGPERTWNSRLFISWWAGGLVVVSVGGW